MFLNLIYHHEIGDDSTIQYFNFKFLPLMKLACNLYIAERILYVTVSPYFYLYINHFMILCHNIGGNAIVMLIE